MSETSAAKAEPTEINPFGEYFVTANYTASDSERISIDIEELRRLSALAERYHEQARIYHENPEAEVDTYHEVPAFMYGMISPLRDSGKFEEETLNHPEFLDLISKIFEFGRYKGSTDDVLDLLIDVHKKLPQDHPAKAALEDKALEYLLNLDGSGFRSDFLKDRPIQIYYWAWLADFAQNESTAAKASEQLGFQLIKHREHPQFLATILARCIEHGSVSFSPERELHFCDLIIELCNAEDQRREAAGGTLGGAFLRAIGRFENTDAHLLDQEYWDEARETAQRIHYEYNPPGFALATPEAA